MAASIFTATHVETGEVLTGNANELGDFFGISKCTIYSLAKTGYLASKKWAIAKEGQPVVIRPPLKHERKKCVICGKTFEAKNKKHIICGYECKKVYKRKATHTWLNEQRKSLKTEAKEIPKTKISVTEIEVEARKAGMSYGQYVAKMGL